MHKQNKYMKISIITITYNSAKTVQRALDSVQNQHYSDIEHIIVDGASSDGTREIVEKYAADHKNVRYISEPDKGIYNALNKGIQMATGDVIGFLHSDDMLYSSDSIGKIAASFENESVDVVYGDLQYCHGDKVIRRWRSNAFRPLSLKFGWIDRKSTRLNSSHS